MKCLVIINGIQYAHWKKVSVKASLNDAARSFSLEVAESAGGAVAVAASKQIMVNDEVVILLGGEKVLTGYVEQRSVSYSSSDHGVQISGRSKTGDLISSSADIKGGQFLNSDLGQISGRITQDYGIKTIIKGDIGAPFESEIITQGESGFRFLERLARSRGKALHDDENGDLVLDEIDPDQGSVASLVEGWNILSAQATMSSENQASEVKVKGQSIANDGRNGKDSTQGMATAKDPNVKRYKPKIIVAEGAMTKEELKQRANWEMAKSAADNIKATITVQGWFHDGGLWKPGEIYDVKSPMIPCDQPLLCESVEWLQSDDGTFTVLSLVPPNSYTPKPAGGAGAKKGTSQAASTSSSSNGQSVPVDKIWSDAKSGDGAIIS